VAGTYTCVAGRWVCSGQQGPTEEICDGLDNDCDEGVDEDGVCGGCVPSPEVCNGCDDDCDGVVDDPPDGGFAPLPCGTPAPGAGSCAGEATCEPAQPAPEPGGCLDGAGYLQCSAEPRPEVCDGIDNDCDHAVDEELAQTGQPCEPVPGLDYGPQSQCTLGVRVCEGANGWACRGGRGATAEVCDGVDNDCNGLVDDQVAGAGQACGPDTPPCSPGEMRCEAGTLQCMGGQPPSPEVCDGIDNDCDGAMDEAPLADSPAPGEAGCWDRNGDSCDAGDLTWDPPVGATCTGAGELTAPCRAGVLVCDGAGGWRCSAPVAPAPEVCDGVDNDCDGDVDEAEGEGEVLSQPCYTPGYGVDTGCEAPGRCSGSCQDGLQRCGAVHPGEWGECQGQVVPAPETCNGLDDDCDGETDEAAELPWIGQPCPASEGVCDGIWQCNEGVRECMGGPPAPGRCNGLDDDCDGLADEEDEQAQDIEDNPEYGQPCGVAQGECEAGTYLCTGGAWACSGGAGPGEELCDGLDNDCDGTPDDGADCPSVGGVDYHCLHASCRPACDPNEPFPCPGGHDCVERDIGGALTRVCLPRGQGGAQ